MGDILGLGISHWPRLAQKNADLAIWLRRTLTDPLIPDHWKDPANWPSRMREEWRRTSVLRDLCVARVSGAGAEGYREALVRLSQELEG